MLEIFFSSYDIVLLLPDPVSGESVLSCQGAISAESL